MTAASSTARLRRAAVAAVLLVSGVLTPVVVAAPAAADGVTSIGPAGAVTETGRLGSAGGGPAESTCPPGSVLTGVDARQTEAVPGRTWLSSAVAVCTAVTLVGDDATLASSVPSAGALTGTDAVGPTTSSTCPAGSIATGLRGFGGALVDQVTLLCSPLTQDGTLLAAVAAPPAGVLGGAPQGPFSCPAGAVAVGLVGRVGEDLDQLGLRCQSLAVTSAPAQAGNTSWPAALLIGNNGVSTPHALTSAGQDRWFRFPVTPGSRVQVDLTGLPADFDLTLFKDISTAFTTLTTPTDLHQLSAEFAADAYSPSAFSPSAFSPSAFSPSAFSPSAFSPSAFSPSAFSPSAFSPSAFSPSAFSPSAFSPSAFSPSAFSPSAFSPSAFSPSAFSPSAFSPEAFAQAFSSAQTRSLIAVSANDGLAPERISASTWNGTGHFYVRVSGRNGAASASPFTVQVTTSGGACATTDLSAGPAPATRPADPAVRTIILTDPSRMGLDVADRARLARSLEAFRAAVGGVVVDLDADTRVKALNARADAATACPYAKNLVAQAARDIVTSYRSSPLRHVVVVGDDSVVPFFRYPDAAGLGPEEDYVPPVAETSASQASLRTNHVLGQDAYGALRDVSVKGATIPVPDLAVGRLVETLPEITTVLDRYVAGTRVLRPTSALTTGYDFLTDAADEVAEQLGDGVGPAGRSDELITDQDVPTSVTTVGGDPGRRTSWTADDLRSALLGIDTAGQAGLPKHDMVFLAGHFSANSALAADYSTTILSTELSRAPAGHFADTLVFSAGCHSGYNIVDDEGIPGVTAGLDWTQALVQQGATLVAGTGYQYGDTEFLEFSERLYAGFARELRTGDAPSIAVGAALARAKQDYLATTVSLRGIDTKSLLEATLYGLPMLGVDMDVRLPDPDPVSVVTASPVAPATAGGALGLSTAAVEVAPTLAPQSKLLTVAGTATAPAGTVSATWLEGPDGAVDANPAEPVLPVDRLDVTVPGKALRGVVLRAADYSDATGITPLTGAPATESSNPFVPFASPAFFPGRLATPNSFDALGGAGQDGRTSLSVTAVQHRSDAPGSLTSTRRAHSRLGLDLYYSGYLGSYTSGGATIVPALAAPPAISSVTATAGSPVQVSARVVGDPSVGMQRVLVTCTGLPGSAWHGTWRSVELAQDPADSTLWRGALPAGVPPSQVRYLVQAVNGVGLVTLDDNRGAYFTPGVTAGQDVATRTATTLVLGADVPGTATYGSTVPVSAVLTGSGTGPSPLAGRRVLFALGTSSVSVVTDAQGRAAADLPVSTLPGALTLTASFDGDATHASSSSAPRAVTVGKQPTSLVLTPPDAAGSVVATLTTTGGIALRDKTVVVVALGSTGAVVGATSAAADPRGRAVVDVRALPLTTRSVQAYFATQVPLVPTALRLADPVLTGSTSDVVATATSLTGTPLPDAVLGLAYTAPVATSPATLTATGLPPGVVLVRQGGSWVLTGTPTRAGASTVVLSSGGPFPTRLPLVVRYVATPFSQPVDDPAGTSPSTFNVRSTVPVKLGLTDGLGVRIPDAEAQALVATCRVKVSLPLTGRTTAQVDEPVVTAAADTGTCLRYDAAADSFHFNATRANLGFAAGYSYILTVTVLAPTDEVLARREVEIGFR